MKTQTRRAAAVAGIALLVGAAGSGAISTQGHTEQQLTHDAVILISAISSDQHRHGDRTAGHHRTHRADWSGRNGTAQHKTAPNTAAQVGVEAAAAAGTWGVAAGQSPSAAGTEVVLKYLPGLDTDGAASDRVDSTGVDSTGVDSTGVDSASADSTGESCS